ncbi:hypothetical protein ACFXC8_48085 [Streptomyces sp. NPDC059441]|uniref:hypothetical protein n=1 Tax=Streptomyces sp. NPDC059441 TaxID=3346829 RepID=UPI0036D090CC
MSPDRPATRLAPYARLPRVYRDRHVLHSTVDAYGRVHWLLTERPPDPLRENPYDALVVTVEEGGQPYETQLSAVRARFTRFDALPDGGFVLANARSRRGEEHVQVFDVLGRTSHTFRVGDAIEDLLVDEAGDIWVGYFDEGVFGDDELSRPGLRRWSSAGEPLWAYKPGPDHDEICDCYALNVGARAVWACPYTDFPLLEIRDNHVVRARANPVRGAHAFAVHADRVVFLGPYGEPDRIVDCRLTERTVEQVAHGRLLRPDGGDLGSHHRIVCRGPRLYVRNESSSDWAVLDISVI